MPQGTVLGPLLFLIFITDNRSGVSSTLRLFADDRLIYRVIDSTRDSELLQQDLNLITEWCNHWQMRLNLEKCVNLKLCHRNLSPVYSQAILLRPTHWKMYVNTITYVSYLIKQCPLLPNNTVSKATKVFNFVNKRNLSGCSPLKKLHALDLVWPTLEYASSVWDLLHYQHWEDSEKSCHSVTSMLEQLATMADFRAKM